ncbi:retrovirus-related pol polyprotein from transposon TNT 1-94 [Tanacetum coccineum]
MWGVGFVIVMGLKCCGEVNEVKVVQKKLESEQPSSVQHSETEITSNSNIVPYSKRAQQISPKLYDGSIIVKDNPVVKIPNSDETLLLAEESRSKMLLKENDPEAIKQNISNKPIDYAALNQLSKDFEKQVPKELPKVSLVNESLKKLKRQLASFDKIVKVRTTPTAMTEGMWEFEHTKAVFRDEVIPFLKTLKDIFNKFYQCLLHEVTKVQTIFNQMETAMEQYRLENLGFEIQKKQFLIENDRLLEQVLSQDVMNIVVNSYVVMNDSVNVNVHMRDDEMCKTCLDLEAVLIKQNEMVEKEEFNKLLKSYDKLEQHCISLELSMQINKEIFQKENKSLNENEPTFDQLFELNNLKAQLQAKDDTIKKLKSHVKRVTEATMTNCMKKDLDEIETINIELEHRVAKLIAENEHLKQTFKQLYDLIKPSRVQAKEHSLKNDLRKLKGKHIVDNVAHVSSTTTITPGMYKLDPVTLAHRVKNNRKAHKYYLKHTIEQAAILREIVEQAASLKPLDSASYTAFAVTPIKKKKTVQFDDTVASTRTMPKVINRPLLSSTGVKSSTSTNGSMPSDNTKNDRISRPPSKAKALCSVCNECLFDVNHDICLIDLVNSMNVRDKYATKRNKQKEEWKPIGNVFNSVGYKWIPIGRTFTLVVQIVLWYLDSGCSKHMTRDRSQLTNFVSKFLGMVKFGNDQIEKIMGYGDYIVGNVTVSRVYYVEGLGHNLFSVCQFCDSDLEVASRKHTCFVRNLEGVDLISGSQETELYTLSFKDMKASTPICLLLKATKTKSWLWHRQLSHLNFGAINYLARHGLVRGLPKLKYEKDHLCSACAMDKSKKQSHTPKSKDSNQEKLYLLHMDLCGPMRVQSANWKRYILVIIDDYSRFTWVKFLTSKDEALAFIIKFLKMIQVRLNVSQPAIFDILNYYFTL